MEAITRRWSDGDAGSPSAPKNSPSPLAYVKFTLPSLVEPAATIITHASEMIATIPSMSIDP